MIVVREVFQIVPEKMKEVKALMLEMAKIESDLGVGPSRAMTDLVGEYYTLVIEADYPSLAEFEQRLGQAFNDERWKQVYAKMRPAIKGGRREMYTLIG